MHLKIKLFYLKSTKQKMNICLASRIFKNTFAGASYVLKTLKWIWSWAWKSLDQHQLFPLAKKLFYQGTFGKKVSVFISCYFCVRHCFGGAIEFLDKDATWNFVSFETECILLLIWLCQEQFVNLLCTFIISFCR